ncbi:Pol-like protein [Plakobranchus ocellatus]|uniref:Pol-like protein n=1 Tax=Plakobranchus ocellatus TaxID=259542 RepID=A0AAV3Z6U8_9GAST|nr:Pol-like protein [Plakobranchus ocellatus]
MDTVVQWNIRGLRSNFEELKLLLNRSQSAAVALQAWGGPGVTPGLHSASSAGWQGGSPRGEVAVLIRNGTRFSEIDLKTGLHAAAATISLEKTLTVCSLYLPPNSPVSKLSLTELFEQLPKPFLVLGDFNVHSPASDDSRRDGWGRMLEEFIAENDFTLESKLLFIRHIIRPQRLIWQWLHPPLPPNVPVRQRSLSYIFNVVLKF